MSSLSEFQLWVPSKADKYTENGLPVYEIIGTDSQIVQFPLAPGKSINCTSGAMAYMSSTVKLSASYRSVSLGRVAGGGSLFDYYYKNESREQDGYVSMTPDYPGVIFPVDMNECPSGKIIAMRDSYLCSVVNSKDDSHSKVSGGFNPSESVSAICCGGLDLIVQTVSGGELAFLMGMGTIIIKTLEEGERVLIDTDSILCFEDTVQVDVRTVGGIAAMCCSGAGVFNTELTGPGKIWIQSLSIDKMRKLFVVPKPIATVQDEIEVVV